ncbi:MAG: protein kinase domain-containing protein [Nevskia sp.]|uniref:protein kinase domain-containing protein n=1 Tax=Nevskia sp. TaxID=1929292 RepID=UPI00403632F7
MSRKLPTAVSDDGAGSIQPGARWQFGEFELNEKRLELRRNGELVKLETKPMNLLMVFLRNPGELITKDELVNALWPNGAANDGMLSNCIAKLRRELRDDDATLIKTVFRFGYRFDAEPRRLDDSSASAAPPKLDLNAGDAPPMRPNWRLVRRLGLSGDSWLAEHAKSRARRVFKFSNDSAGLSALKREVTVYRLLRESLGDKPCYVDLLDWNFDEAPWFTEAEYCPAGSLQEWFTAQGGIDSVPFATRIDLIIQIADALAAVHAVGVLHKDLKPANIFVVIDDDGRPTIRLADFGASGLHDSAFLQRLEITRAGFTQMLDTGSGNAAGTLLYLAPEVAAGQPATVKADIYALGLMLYQFVTGGYGRQLSTGWESEIDDELLREDIAAATEGNPERRLADAGELGRRLRHLDQRRTERAAERQARLQHERRARQLERARVRRWWLRVAVASMVLGLIGTSLFAYRANEARRVAETEAARAKAVGDFLADGMFAEINSDVRKVGDMTVKDLLDRSAAHMPVQFQSAPDTQRDLHLAMARAYSALGYTKESGVQFAAADALVVAHQGAQDERRLDIASKWITVSFSLGQLKENIRKFETVAEQSRPVSEAGRAALRQLKGELVRARLFLGQGDLAKHGALQRLAEPITDPLEASESWRSLGMAQFKLFEVHDAQQSLSKALVLRRSVPALPSRRLVPLLCNLAYAEIEGGQLAEAEAHLREADAIASSWFGEMDGWRVVISGGQAMLAHHRGYSDTALATLRAAVDTAFRTNEKTGSAGNGESMWQLTRVLNDVGRYQEAAEVLDILIPHDAALLAPDSIELVRIRFERVRALQGLADAGAAQAELAAIRTVLESKALAPEHPLMLQLALLEAPSTEPVISKLAKALYAGHPSLMAARPLLAVGKPL